MNLTLSKRLSSLAFASLLCTMSVGCGPESTAGEPEPATAETPTQEPAERVSGSAVVCASGWHAHYATWPDVGMYYAGQCSTKAYTIHAGTWVCMQSVSATPCNGQGYTLVYEPGAPYSYWARTEAFDGH